MVRFKWYLKHRSDWKSVSSRVEGWSDFLQYIKHPEFTINEAGDRRWDRDEPWMKKIMRPDPNCFAYKIHLMVNGHIIHTENFISLDGHRIYVPIPNVEYAHTDKEEDNIYYYDKTQILLAGVLGKYHYDKNLDDFCNKSGIRLDFVPSTTAKDKK